MLRKLLLLSIITLPLFLFTHVQANVIDTSLWAIDFAPSYSANPITTTWTSLGGGGQAVTTDNGYGSLISDFSLSGDFVYSGTVTPTFSATGYNDNDTLGIVFGWADIENHYRLGWTQPGNLFDNGTGDQGMFLVREQGGVSTSLFQIDNFWDDNIAYDFVIERSGSNISFDLNGVMQTISDTSFMSGMVGVYSESQSVSFTNLAVNTVPEPTTILLFGIGLLGFAGVSRKKA